jgi:hypothetical protein
MQYRADKPEAEQPWQVFLGNEPLTDHRGLVFFETGEKAEACADKLNKRRELNRKG